MHESSQFQGPFLTQRGFLPPSFGKSMNWITVFRLSSPHTYV